MSWSNPKSVHHSGVAKVSTQQPAPSVPFSGEVVSRFLVRSKNPNFPQRGIYLLLKRRYSTKGKYSALAITIISDPEGWVRIDFPYHKKKSTIVTDLAGCVPVEVKWENLQEQAPPLEPSESAELNQMLKMIGYKDSIKSGTSYPADVQDAPMEEDYLSRFKN
ncbi:TPA_asm: hypothetical protein [African termite bidnaparvovirus]|nr:TPA_asm: hypothetical protein [African termite bidnaparvovirus]